MSLLEPTFISLFAGAGGLDLGLEQAGWTCLYASDADPLAVDTLLANKGAKIGRSRLALEQAVVERADVRSLSADHILSSAGVRRGDVPLLAGGPPCQSWSSAGHQLGFDDPRGRLFEDFVRLAVGIDARWLLLENVRGLLTARGADGVPGSALQAIRDRLLRAGYHTSVHLLNAADFGVPQRRVRLFIVGFQGGDAPTPPKPTHAKSATERLKPWVPLSRALQHVGRPSLEDVLRPKGDLAESLGRLSPGQGVKSPGKAEATRPNGHWGYKQGAFLADLQKSARTVTANAQQDWIIDPELGLRRLTPKECAAIQSFPKNWKFEGNTVARYRLAGNAVPPLLARQIGAALLRHVRKASLPEPRPPLFGERLLPLPKELAAAIAYTIRDEQSNGASRRLAPNRRLLRGSRLAEPA